MTADPPPALELRAVERVHGRGPTAVRALGPVDLSVAGSEFTAIMGPSGSGKSTLLALAGALDTPSSGTVRVHGADLGQLSRTELAALRRRRLGYVFQDLNLLPGLTAAENVMLPLELDGIGRGEARREAFATLERVGLAALAERFPDDLSGGERQRVAIARAVVGPRSLLLADEPTGALDTVTGERVLRMLRAQADAGQSVVLVTHDPSHAAWADRVLHLRDGRWDTAPTTPDLRGARR